MYTSAMLQPLQPAVAGLLNHLSTSLPHRRLVRKLYDMGRYARPISKASPTFRNEFWRRNKRTRESRSLSITNWYFGNISRKKAEELLLQPRNEHGAFLVRDSEIRPEKFTLSMRHHFTVEHHRIHRLEGGDYFINRLTIFHTLHELISYYSGKDGSGDVFLLKPCIQVTGSNVVDSTYGEWEVKRSSVRLIRKVGAGHFGVVMEGRLNTTVPVAVKMLDPGVMDVRDFLAEANIMKKIRHKNLVQLYGMCTLEGPIYIIMELVEHGSLFDYLHAKGHELEKHQLVDMGVQIACGMAYLEVRNYIHRDLAARNILVKTVECVKIADFGLARHINEEVYNARKGTPFPIRWTAPEAARFSTYSTKSDVWSFGILLTELFTCGQIPYYDTPINEVLRKVEGGYRMPCPTDCPTSLYEVMRDTWHDVPAERPTFKTLLCKLEDIKVSVIEAAMAFQPPQLAPSPLLYREGERRIGGDALVPQRRIVRIVQQEQGLCQIL